MSEINKAIDRFRVKFQNPHKFDSSSQFNPELAGRLWQEFESFLRTELEAQERRLNMDEQKINKIIKVMEMVAEDTANDAKNFDGKEFNGRNVAVYFGNHGAAIKAVADAVKTILQNMKLEQKLQSERGEG